MLGLHLYRPGRGDAGQCLAITIVAVSDGLRSGCPRDEGLALRERLGQGKEDEHKDDGAVAGEEPDGAAPAKALGEGAADDGGDEGAHEGAQVEEAHRSAALAGLPNVGNSAGADGLHRGRGAAREDAEDDEHGNVDAHAADEGEDDV